MKKESESQAKEIHAMRQTFDQYKESYEALDKTTKEMQTDRGQKVNEDIDNSKEIVEIKAQLSKVNQKLK